MSIKQIEYNSKEYRESVELRNQILRLPLGLFLSERDLQTDNSDIHIAFFEKDKIIGIVVLTPIDKYVIKMRQVAVLKEYQGKGVGSGLVKFAEKTANSYKFLKIILNARSTALDFYTKMGYQTIGDEYVDENINIPHCKMMKYIV